MFEGYKVDEGSRTMGGNPPRPCDEGHRGCEAESSRIGWPERVVMKVIVKGDPRVVGRRGPVKKVEGYLATLETRRFAGTLSIGVLATPAVNILPLTNLPGGLWVVLLTEKGRQIMQSERIEREDRRSERTRENARWRARDARARKGRGTTRRHGRG